MVVFYLSSVIGCFLSTHPGILDPFYVKFIACINWLRSIVAICEKKWICLPGFEPKPPAHQASRNLRWDTECSVVFSFNLLTRLNTNKILTMFCQWKWGTVIAGPTISEVIAGPTIRVADVPPFCHKIYEIYTKLS